jgi:hypothetical protein
MPEEKQESVAIRLVHEAEHDADVYREALLEMSLENDQLYNDYCRMYDKIVQISARIDMANSCLSSPEIALSEIETILRSVDR